jgi:hypothetical protein
VEPNAYKIGSALTRLGLKHGDVVYFVTYEMAQLFQMQISIFLLGGAVRGCHPTDKISKQFHHLFRKYLIKKITGNFTKQINEVNAKFVIVDKETIESVKEACKGVHHSIQFLSVGEKVPGTVNFEDLLQDDGTGKFKRKPFFYSKFLNRNFLSGVNQLKLQIAHKPQH